MNKKGLFWIKAPDIKSKTIKIIKSLNISYIKISKLHFYRSYNSKARARARIWGLPKLWQNVLKEGPHYIIEVISEKFDNLTDNQKNEILIHELMHIPKNFSGSLVPHYKRNKKRNFNNKVQTLFKSLIKNNNL